jgi:hypothetical protein
MDAARFSAIVHQLISDPDSGTPEDRALILVHLSMMENGDQAAKDLIAAAPAAQLPAIRDHMETFRIIEHMPPIDDVLKSFENLP